jgi:CHAT domain-containing protein
MSPALRRRWCASVPRRHLRCLLGSLLLLATAAARAEVVVTASTEEAKALGIEAGDVLVAWWPAGEEAARKPLTSWLDPWRLDHLEMPAHGELAMEVRRERQRRVVRLPRRPLEVEVRPILADGVLAAIEAIVTSERPMEERIAALQARLSAAGSGADTTSWALAQLATEATARGALDEAVTASAAAAAAASFAPTTAELLRRQGDALRRLRRLPEAETVYHQALGVWRQHAGDGVGSSLILSALGNLAGQRHELAEAGRLAAEACAIRQRAAPGSWLVANCSNNLGILAGRRGDLATADSHFATTLDLHRSLGMEPVDALANLGIVARLRGDLERAETYVREALEHRERQGDWARAAALRNNLANIVADRGDDARALAIYDRLIENDLRRAPNPQVLAQAQINRAKVQARAARFEEAIAGLDEAQALLGFTLPDTPDAADIVQLRAEVALLRGEHREAAAACATALAAHARLRPDTLQEAMAASLCARIAAAAGDPARADELFRRSLTTLERQQQRIGGGERGLVAFRDKLQPYYREYVTFLLEQGRDAEAFEIYERSRAQALRSLVRQRDLELGSRVPAELAQRRAALGGEIEVTYRKLAALPDGAAEGAALRDEIDRLHARREEISTQIRAASPAVAALEAPPALELAEIAAGLGPGTLVLAYDLGAENSRLFTVTPAGTVETHDLAEDVGALAAAVDRWVDLAARPRDSAAQRLQAERLSRILLAPAAARLASAQRLLVIPDGPLHRLAFAALPPPPRVSDKRYLVELMPIGREVSASVAVGDGAARGRRDQSSPVVVFGDPTSSSAAVSRFRRELGGLPASRREAAAVGEVFGARARVFLGDAATEAAARSTMPGAGIAHFASHAVVDELLPFDSALVLAPGEDGEGLLQAWEIAEDLRLDGSLVVLSACDTARGGARAGEGIVGLVRALQIAGADAVVASLWQVADESTAELMSRFYRHLEGGAARDEAMRRAQLELIAGPVIGERDGRPIRLDATAPRHWAPFVLLGSRE